MDHWLAGLLTGRLAGPQYSELQYMEKFAALGDPTPTPRPDLQYSELQYMENLHALGVHNPRKPGPTVQRAPVYGVSRCTGVPAPRPPVNFPFNFALISKVHLEGHGGRATAYAAHFPFFSQ